MASFDQLAHDFQQAQEEVRTVGSRGARQRLDTAAQALHASPEAAAQRAATGMLASKISPGRSRSRR